MGSTTLLFQITLVPYHHRKKNKKTDFSGL